MAEDLPTLDQTPHLRETDRGRFVIDILLRHWALVIALAVVGAGLNGSLLALAAGEAGLSTALIDRVSLKSFTGCSVCVPGGSRPCWNSTLKM